MAIAVFEENVVTLAEAAKRLPTVKAGKPPHVSTLYRWAQRGCRSHDRRVVRLETIKVGGTTCTSLEALQRFFDRLSDDTTTVSPPTHFSRRRQRQIEAAERELDKAGI